MKKIANILIVLGSGLAAYGVSFWQLTTDFKLLPGEEAPRWYDLTAGWSPYNRVEITLGITMLTLGIVLRKDSNSN
jgi:hypothetical protein